MKGHDFNFDGGEHLARIGATWFVSYLYHLEKDSGHTNWKNVKTYTGRINIFNRTKQYHQLWLAEVLKMNGLKLNTNKISINARQTKQMAKALLGI